jgi:peptidoglycan/LPS O-acetylase OafA/YrhL
MSLSPFWTAAITTLLALACNWCCLRFIERRGARLAGPARFGPIDGLRGLLAFAVFLHHAAIWDGYRSDGLWRLPNNFLANLGPVAVSLFFMITAFLFTTKVIEAERTDGRFWARFVRSRVLRIVPLYLCFMAWLLLAVGRETGWTRVVDWSALSKQIIVWLTFTFAGNGPINGFTQTAYIAAGVTWTLPYEWAFYLLLPVVALVLRKRSPLWAFGLCLVVPLACLRWTPGLWYALPFTGGMLAAALVKHAGFCRAARSAGGGAVAGLALAWAIFGLAPEFSLVSTAVLTVAFCLMAGGNSLGGLLTLRSVRFFGQPAYSIYLLHGPLLYAVFRFVLSRDASAALSHAHYAAIVFLVAPVLVVLSHASFRWIELPGMALAIGRAPPGGRTKGSG